MLYVVTCLPIVRNITLHYIKLACDFYTIRSTFHKTKTFGATWRIQPFINITMLHHDRTKILKHTVLQSLQDLMQQLYVHYWFPLDSHLYLTVKGLGLSLQILVAANPEKGGENRNHSRSPTTPRRKQKRGLWKEITTGSPFKGGEGGLGLRVPPARPSRNNVLDTGQV